MRFLMALGVVVCLSGLGAGQRRVLYTLHGNGAGEHFGAALRGTGDVDGDGFPDLIVGAPFSPIGAAVVGFARVFSGQSGALLWTFSSGVAGDLFGLAVSGAGDVNGDGRADLIVGGRLASNNGAFSGSAWVYSGLDGTLLYLFNGSAAGDFFGNSVSGTGDVNGDGFADVIVGAPGSSPNGSSSGSAQVFSGVDGSVLFTLAGDSVFDKFGLAVSGVGDLDQDGFSDFIVGAPRDDNAGFDTGSVRAFSGQSGTPLFTVDGIGVRERLGSALSGAGDVNHDSVPDLIVGAPLGGGAFILSAGLVRVFSGAGGALLFTLHGGTGSLQNGTLGDHRFGSSVSGAGDVNGDGTPDLIVTASGISSNLSIPGTAQVFSGLDGSLLFTLGSDTPGDLFGAAVSGAGDVNGDGFGDLLVGAPLADNSGTDSGSVRVFPGGPALELAGPPTAALGSTLSYSLASPDTPPGSLYGLLYGHFYLFDVSLTGGAPGLPLPPPQGGAVLLNPPLLNLTFGSQLPGLFTDFFGLLGTRDRITPTIQIPNTPALVGLTVFAAGITVNLQGPPTLGLVSNGVQTLITP